MEVFERLKTAGPDDVLIKVDPIKARRIIGVGAMLVLAVILIWDGMNGQGETAARIVLILIGVLALWAATRLWPSSANSLELTPTCIRQADGQVLCMVDNVLRIDRGWHVLKPSNGFLIHLKEPAPRHLTLGLWWRLGRIVAIGGMTNAGQGKAMVEVLNTLLAMREKTD